MVVGSALVLALGLGGCDESYCEESIEDPLRALFKGLLCSGHRGSQNRSPQASFTVTPNPVVNGGTVRLDASASSDPEGPLARYEWDVTSDPGYELDARAESVVEQQVFGAGGLTEPRVINLRVTDHAGATAETAELLTINATGAPTASFSATPDAALVGQPVSFDASASTGALVYRWDFDGDGVDDVQSTTATATHTYDTPGEKEVRLRVGDLLGRSAELRKVLVVRPAARAVARSARAAKRPFSARLSGVSFPTDLGRARTRGEVTSFRGLRSRGRLIASRRGLGALRRFRKSSWVTRVNLSANRRTGRATLRGLALATFPRGRGRACVRLFMTSSDGGAPTGRLTVRGGTGAAARLAGRARFSLRFQGDVARLQGRIRSRNRRPRPLPPACARLARTQP